MWIKKLEELRRIHLEIKEKVTDGAEKKSNEEMLLNAMNRILELNNIARLEGLLALDMEAENMGSEEGILKELILLMVDGTDPQILLGIGMARYYAGLYSDYEALKYFIYLEGVLSIQAGEHPRIVEEKLKVMLPTDVYIQYSQFREQEKKEAEKKKNQNLVEDLCKGERLWNSGDSGYYVSRLVDYFVCDVTDKEMQRVLREVDNRELAMAMKGMSGKARKHIFSNMSDRLAILVAEDMTYMGPVRAVDITEASQKLLNVSIRLIDMGEISSYDYLEPFYNVFSVDTKSKRENSSKISQLRKMVEEYEQAEHMVLEFSDILK